MTYKDGNYRTVQDSSIKNCTISNCTFTINIGNINMKFGDINISVGDTRNKRTERISNAKYINEELDARMRFFKANSP